MRKKLLILGLMMMMVLTACGGTNKETEPTEDITGNEYFKPLVEEINGDKDSGITAKFDAFTKAFQMILKDGYKIEDVENARATVIDFSKEFLEDTGKKGYKVEYLDSRDKKRPLLQAIDGEITIDSFEVIDLTEESVRELATELFDTSDITEVSVVEGVVTVKYDKKIVVTRDNTLNGNARFIVRFLGKVLKNEEVKQVNLHMLYKIKDDKGTENLEEIVYFQCDRNSISGVDWINMEEMARKDYRKLGNIATIYNVRTDF